MTLDDPQVQAIFAIFGGAPRNLTDEGCSEAMDACRTAANAYRSELRERILGTEDEEE